MSTVVQHIGNIGKQAACGRLLFTALLKGQFRTMKKTALQGGAVFFRLFAYVKMGLISEKSYLRDWGRSPAKASTILSK